jgi:MFS family permease
MDPRKHTTAYFVLEGANSFGTTLYFYYVYFFTEQQFGFTKFQNLLLAAGLGLTYGISSMVGGRFAQRRGYVPALEAGYAIMALAIGTGIFVSALPVHLAIMFAAVIGMALTWPALEALVSEGRSRGELQRNVGIYNLVWGGFGALAYFSGGAIFKAAGFRAMFVVPAVLHVLQLLAVLALQRGSSKRGIFGAPAENEPVTDQAVRIPRPAEHEHERLRSTARAKAFLRMAWLANPFGYLAINSVIAVMPAVANRLQLTVAQAGIFCSVWLFVRTASFGLLWLWPGWVSLAGHGLCHDDGGLHYAVARGESVAGHRCAGAVRFRARADLLFVPLLLDGRGRNQGRARRPS